MKPNDKRPAANIKYAQKRSESCLNKRKQQYVGAVINGWEIIDVYKKEGARDYFCSAICPKCHRQAELRLGAVKKTNKCIKCTNNVKAASAVIHEVTDVDGTSLKSIKLRLDGKVNCNSSTGVNGVFKDRDRYRACITFKGKKIYLGYFDNLNSATKARKQAEQMIYGEFLDKHKGWEDEVKKTVQELCKKSK